MPEMRHSTITKQGVDVKTCISISPINLTDQLDVLCDCQNCGSQTFEVGFLNIVGKETNGFHLRCKYCEIVHQINVETELKFKG